MRFGPPEYFTLTLFGLFLAAYLASTSHGQGPDHGLILGLLLDMIGIDPIAGDPALQLRRPAPAGGARFRALGHGALRDCGDPDQHRARP
ncbi:MAG: hypothetical protein MZU91_12030 [Desulfosudis oleivorans]|nr:hypothetical protein [Desulfosudis oleivorans]